MNKYKERVCDECNEIKERRFLGKIRGRYLCKKCRSKVRQEHREQTIKKAGIKKEIKELERKEKKESNRKYQKRKKRKGEESPPIPKGSKIKNKKEKSNSFITFQERKSYLKILMDNRGLGYDEAKERLDNLIEYEREIRKKFKEKGKEEEIKQKQQELLEELWNF